MFCFKYSPVMIKRDESCCFQKNMNFTSMIVISSILMGSVIPIPFLVNLLEWSPPPPAVFLYAYWGGVLFLGIKSKQLCSFHFRPFIFPFLFRLSMIFDVQKWICQSRRSLKTLPATMEFCSSQAFWNPQSLSSCSIFMYGRTGRYHFHASLISILTFITLFSVFLKKYKF